VPFIERAPPLFISSSELHDYIILEDSDDDPSESSNDYGGDGVPGP
jgi:hypothetical protein